MPFSGTLAIGIWCIDQIRGVWRFFPSLHDFLFRPSLDNFLDSVIGQDLCRSLFSTRKTIHESTESSKRLDRNFHCLIVVSTVHVVFFVIYNNIRVFVR